MQIKYIRIVCWNRFAFVKLCKYLLKSNKPDEPYNGAFITLYLTNDTVGPRKLWHVINIIITPISWKPKPTCIYSNKP